VVILQAAGLHKSYGAAMAAVSQADILLQDGEFVSIVGRSGSGKSTLLAMIGALTRPTAGRVLLDGADIWMLPEAELASVRCRAFGFVFQFPSLLPNFRAIDNVVLPALLGRTMPVAHAYARATTLLERVGLQQRTDAYPAELSGGEQRRIAIARALINSPRVLLADEPTGDLDEDTESDVVALLDRLRHETPFGLMLVTHNTVLARRADRTFVMERGVLGTIDLPPALSVPAPQMRRFASLQPANDPVPVDAVPEAFRLGRDLWAVAGPRAWRLSPCCSRPITGSTDISSIRCSNGGNSSHRWKSSQPRRCVARSHLSPVSEITAIESRSTLRTPVGPTSRSTLCRRRCRRSYRSDWIGRSCP
jgi:ABC-type lipoprotein export system ATPase subunit